MSPPRAGRRCLGLDYGRVRIGVATCDRLGLTTREVGHVRRESDVQAARVVAALAQREEAEAIVIGLPLHVGGTVGANVRWVRDFLVELARVCPLPVHEVDERYSSGEAEESLRAEGKWPCPPGAVDARAAAILLRRFLEGED